MNNLKRILISNWWSILAIVLGTINWLIFGETVGFFTIVGIFGLVIGYVWLREIIYWFKSKKKE